MIAFIVSLSFFMEALDSTIINTAIPAMSRSLSVEPIDLKLALISYLLSLAIFIPISGWLADKFGSKKVFLSALAIFTLSSLWCGFADSLLQYSCMNSLGYADVAPEDLSAATSMMSTLQQLSQSFGVAVSALFIRLFSSTSADLILTPPIFHYTFFAMGFFTILSSVIFIQLQREDGQQMIV